MWLGRSTMSKSISIQLLEPIIFVGDNLETPPVIRGTINMNLARSCIVNKLHIDFKGTMKMCWINSKLYFIRNNPVLINTI